MALPFIELARCLQRVVHSRWKGELADGTKAYALYVQAGLDSLRD
jgi:hypothetical protein